MANAPEEATPEDIDMEMKMVKGMFDEADFNGNGSVDKFELLEEVKHQMAEMDGEGEEDMEDMEDEELA